MLVLSGYDCCGTSTIYIFMLDAYFPNLSRLATFDFQKRSLGSWVMHVMLLEGSNGEDRAVTPHFQPPLFMPPPFWLIHFWLLDLSSAKRGIPLGWCLLIRMSETWRANDSCKWRQWAVYIAFARYNLSVNCVRTWQQSSKFSCRTYWKSVKFFLWLCCALNINGRPADKTVLVLIESLPTSLTFLNKLRHQLKC